MLKHVLTSRWLAIALAANLMLWLSMLYTVFAIDMYSDHRVYFIATTWIIFVIPFLILGGWSSLHTRVSGGTKW